MKIKKYKEFINETVSPEMEQQAKVSAIISDIQRNYLNYPSISSVNQAELEFLEEKRSWPNFIKTAKLDTVIDSTGKFYIKYSKEGGIYELRVDFKISYKGIENYDSPVSDMFPEEIDGKELGVALEDLKIVRLQARTDFLRFDSQNILPDLNKTVLGFMLKVLRPEFNLISDESLIIRQL
jgi:hypothetical protein